MRKIFKVKGSSIPYLCLMIIAPAIIAALAFFLDLSIYIGQIGMLLTILFLWNEIGVRGYLSKRGLKKSPIRGIGVILSIIALIALVLGILGISIALLVPFLGWINVGIGLWAVIEMFM